jgi:hypothetical protein
MQPTPAGPAAPPKPLAEPQRSALLARLATVTLCVRGVRLIGGGR